MSRHRSRGRASRAAVATGLSLLAHSALLSALLLLLEPDPVRVDGNHGSYVVLSDQTAAKTPARARVHAPDRFTPARAEPRRAAAEARRRPAPPTATVATTAPGTAEEASVSGVEGPGPAAREGAWWTTGPVVGDPEPSGTTNPSPECLDGIDNDGDRLIDHEDPGCWPELPREELVSKLTGAAVRSEMRRGDLPRGDPERLARDRVLALLRPDGDSLVFQDGALSATIGPDGEVDFARKRTLPFGIQVLDRSPGPRWRSLERRRFMDATEEIRADREQRARASLTKTALAGLGMDLEALWRDRSLSLRQKKTLLFERLEECDTDTPEGRQAARTIVELIRRRFRSPDDPRPTSTTASSPASRTEQAAQR